MSATNPGRIVLAGGSGFLGRVLADWFVARKRDVVILTRAPRAGGVIHEEDFCRAVEWLMEHEEMSGPINLAAPNPLANAEMMRVMRRLCGVRFGLPASRWMLELGAVVLRTETELILKSRRVAPGRLLASGFEFKFPAFEGAAGQLLSRSS